MIFIPSRGRPHLLRQFIEAYRKTKATAPVFVLLDPDDPKLPEYQALCESKDWPENWDGEVGAKRMKCPEACQWYFETHPNEPFYALFGDDTIPETPFWDRRLILAAGTKRVSYGKDPITWPRAPHPVVGGDLVRAVGYWALPGVLHWYMDTLYEWLAERTGRLVPCPDVITLHRNPDLGNGQNDQTYDERWMDLKTGIKYSAQYDVDIWKKWCSNGEGQKALDRIKELCPL